jgi:hypothetical protein
VDPSLRKAMTSGMSLRGSQDARTSAVRPTRISRIRRTLNSRSAVALPTQAMAPVPVAVASSSLRLLAAAPPRSRSRHRYGQVRGR